MRNITIVFVVGLLLCGCASQPTSQIIGQWEATELSHDLGRVHAVWTFSADGKTKWDTSILNGKEMVRDKGTYTVETTNLVVHLERYGRHVYKIVTLDDRHLRLGDNTRTNVLELRRRR
jgi:uncharacterized protein YceK